jgi:hypothetical protein
MVYEPGEDAQLVILSHNREPLTRERRVKVLKGALLMEQGLKIASRRRNSVTKNDLRAIRTIRSLK